MAKKNDNYVDLKTQPIPEGQHLLEVDDLKMYFHTEDGVVHAVDGVSYTLDRGETLGVVGESGSGKSVTAMTIMGLISMPPGKIEGGSVTYRGHDLLSMSEEEMQHVRGNDIAMIFQDPMTSLNPVYKIGRQVGEGLRLHRGYSKQEALKRATELLDLVGIPEPEKRVNQYPHQFSGGMRQRVMIAMALACDPDILIADEPTTALDVTIQAQIIELMQEMQEKNGNAIIMITHDLGVVADMADKIMVMYAGHRSSSVPPRRSSTRAATPNLGSDSLHFRAGDRREEAPHADERQPAVAREPPQGLRLRALVPLCNRALPQGASAEVRHGQRPLFQLATTPMTMRL